MTRRSLSLTSLVLGLPVFGFLVTAAVVVVGLPSQPVRYARLFGGPLSAEGRLYARALVYEELDDSLTVSALESVVVGVEGGARLVEVEQTTAPDGTLEVSLPYRRGEVLTFRRRSDGALLARGVPGFGPPDSHRKAPRRGGRLGGTRRGEFPADVFVESGVLATPFRGALLLKARGGEASCDVSVMVRGAQVHSPETMSLGSGGEVRLELTPFHHDAEVELIARRAGVEVGRLTSALPIAAGAFFPRFEGERVFVSAPLSRERVYYAWVSETSRLASGSLSLTPGRDGTWSGEMQARRFEGEGPLYLVLSTEPDVALAGTVGFPLTAGSATFDASDHLLLDGRPLNFKAELERRARVRLGLVLYVGCIFALSVSLFVLDARRRARGETARLLREGVEPSAVAPSGGLLLATALLSLGMSATLVWFALFAG